jgi:hypothetical protein
LCQIISSKTPQCLPGVNYHKNLHLQEKQEYKNKNYEKIQKEKEKEIFKNFSGSFIRENV